MPAVQCLFCNHLNRADARFCNDCGSQMHLQPCDRCGAVDKRSAKNCYKCGARFTLPAAPELDSAPAAIDDQLADPAPNHVDLAPEQAPPEPQQVDEAPSPENAATAPRSRRPWQLAALAIVLAAVAMSVHYYSGPTAQSAQQAKKKDVMPLAPVASVVPTSTGATPTTVAAPVDTASVAKGTTSVPAASTSGLDDALSTAPPGAGVAMTMRPSRATDAERKTRQDPPIFKECPEAVAALGLCNPSTKQEKQ